MLAGTFDQFPNVFVDVAFVHNARQPENYAMSSHPLTHSGIKQAPRHNAYVTKEETEETAMPRIDMPNESKQIFAVCIHDVRPTRPKWGL